LAILINPDNPLAGPERADAETAARTLGQRLEVLSARGNLIGHSRKNSPGNRAFSPAVKRSTSNGVCNTAKTSSDAETSSDVNAHSSSNVPIEEYPQTVPNLTAATSNLFDLIQSRGIALYSDAAMRLAVSRAIIVESSRGWRLDKLKQQHKIDVVVALSMACLAAVRGHGKPGYDLFAPGLFDDDAEDRQAGDERYRRELGAHIYACTGIWPR
jgi:hypothetical protein